MRKNYSIDREKLLKFEAEGQEFCKISEITRTIYSNSERLEQFLRSLEHFFQTVKGQNNFGIRIFF